MSRKERCLSKKIGRSRQTLSSKPQFRTDCSTPKVIIRYEAEVECDLDLKAVERYLNRRKWRDVGLYGRFGRSFESDEYGETVTLPTTDSVADFNARIAELVRTLAWYEKRPVPEIPADMQ
jgi:hypothetical protein